MDALREFQTGEPEIVERLLADDTVTEIMVVDPETIYVERLGKIVATALRFTDDEAVRAR